MAAATAAAPSHGFTLSPLNWDPVVRIRATTARNCNQLGREVPQHRAATLLRMDERVLAERLITYDTSNVEGLRAAAGFIKGWLEAREIEVTDHQYGQIFALTAEVGAKSGPTLVFHGHYDVVPARPEQFEPRVQGDRLIGRGAYDM